MSVSIEPGTTLKPSLLIIVTADPRTSGRPAEAVRIAAGVGAWQKVDTRLYLCGEAVRALAEDAEQLVDGEWYSRYLPLMAESGRSLYVQANSPALMAPGEPTVEFQAITEAQLSSLVAQSTYVLRF